jgi:hypothetical protein
MLGLHSHTGFDLLTRYYRLVDIRARPLTPQGGRPLPTELLAQKGCLPPQRAGTKPQKSVGRSKIKRL